MPGGINIGGFYVVTGECETDRVIDLLSTFLSAYKPGKDRQVGASADVQPSGRIWFDARSKMAPDDASHWLPFTCA